MGILREPGLDKEWTRFKNSEEYVRTLELVIEYFSRWDDIEHKNLVRLAKRVLKRAQMKKGRGHAHKKARG